MTNFQFKYLGHCDTIVFFQELRATGFYKQASGSILNAMQNGVERDSEFQRALELYACAKYFSEKEKDNELRDCWTRSEQSLFDKIFGNLPQYMSERDRDLFEDPRFTGTGVTRLILSKLTDHLYGDKAE